jgi:hypothetical protein
MESPKTYETPEGRYNLDMKASSNSSYSQIKPYLTAGSDSTSREYALEDRAERVYSYSASVRLTFENERYDPSAHSGVYEQPMYKTPNLQIKKDKFLELVHPKVCRHGRLEETCNTCKYQFSERKKTEIFK